MNTPYELYLKKIQLIKSKELEILDQECHLNNLRDEMAELEADAEECECGSYLENTNLHMIVKPDGNIMFTDLEKNDETIIHVKDIPEILRLLQMWGVPCGLEKRTVILGA